MFIEADGDGVFIFSPQKTITGVNFAVDFNRGDVVLVTGVSSAGEYAPMILPTALKVIRRGELHAPIPATLTDLNTGMLESRWVESEGILRQVVEKENTADGWNGDADLVLVQGGTRVRIEVPDSPVQKLHCSWTAGSRVRGICVPEWTKLSQWRGARMVLQSLSDLVVVQPGHKAPWTLPALPYDELLRFRGGHDWNHRVKIAGVVTHHVQGRGLHLQFAGRSLFAETDQPDAFAPGDQVEAIGFA
jgi:hypothetical protein